MRAAGVRPVRFSMRRSPHVSHLAAAPIDTSRGTTFEVFGLDFKQPPDWTVESQDPDAQQNPYATWSSAVRGRP